MNTEQLVDSWCKDALDRILALTKGRRSGISVKIRALASQPDQIQSLQEIAEITKQYTGGLSEQIHHEAQQAINHTIIARAAINAAKR